MATGRAERIFGSLGPDEIATLLARVWDAIPGMNISGAQLREFERALQFFGLPENAMPVRIARDAIARTLKGHIVELPVAVLLNTSVQKGGPQAEDHNRLLVWTTIAALVLLERSEGHWSKVDTACDAVRLANRIKEHAVLNHFVGKTKTAADILGASKQSPQHDFFVQTGPGRLDPIRVLFEAYLNFQPPVTRSRSVIEHADTYYVTTQAPISEADLEDLSATDLHQGQTTAYLKSGGDKNNPEHMPHREFIDLPAIGRPEHFSVGPLQNLRRRSAAQHIMRRKMALPCAWGAMTDHEIAVVMKKCVIELDTEFGSEWRVKILIGAALLTGRTPEALMAMPRGPSRPKHPCSEWLEIDGYTVRLCFAPSLPITKISAAHRRLLAPDSPQPLKLTLPGAVGSPLADMFMRWPDLEIEPKRIADEFKSLWPKGHRRQTLQRLSQVLRDRAIRAGLDPTMVAYLVGESPRNEPGLYYVTHNNAAIEQAYRQVVDDLPYSDVLFGSALSHPVGSALTIEKKAIRSFFQLAERSLTALPRAKRSEIVAYHNRLVALVCFSLMLQTGHRPVKAMFELLTDIDLDARVIFISDKEIRITGAGRIIPLAPITIRQIRAWLSHLRNLRGRVEIRHDAILSSCEAALSGSDYLLFEIRDDASGLSTAPVTPRFLEQQLKQNIWPFQLNWARHVQRRLLSSLPGELVDAWMGHAHPGAELYGSASAASFHDLGPLRAALEQIFRDLGVRVFRGLT